MFARSTSQLQLFFLTFGNFSTRNGRRFLPRRNGLDEVIKYAARGCEGALITPSPPQRRSRVSHLGLLSRDVYFKGCYQHLSVARRKKDCTSPPHIYIYIARESLFYFTLFVDERGGRSCFHYTRVVSQPDRFYDQRRNWLCLLTVATLWLCFKVINGNMCETHWENHGVISATKER